MPLGSWFRRKRSKSTTPKIPPFKMRSNNAESKSSILLKLKTATLAEPAPAEPSNSKSDEFQLADEPPDWDQQITELTPNCNENRVKQREMIGEHKLLALEFQPYYHGMIPKVEMEPLLEDTGYFLVRKALLKGVEQILLTVKWEGVNRDFIIQKKGKKFMFTGKGFPSVGALIYHHWSNGAPITHETGVLLLWAVCLDKWELSHSAVQLDQKIGEGSFGQVFAGRIMDRETRKFMKVAVKRCHVLVSFDEKRDLLAEAIIMRKYLHPNVVRMIGVCAQKDPLMIVMELVQFGALRNLLIKNGKREISPLLARREKSQFMLDIASGMQYLENKSCIHRDLACRNCMVGKNRVIKIGDFGLSKIGNVYQLNKQTKIPVKWTAPEAMNNFTYSSKSDVWSFGIVIWEIWADGASPYEPMTPQKVKTEVTKGYRLEPPKEMPEELTSVMKSCWLADPKDRPTFGQIFVHLAEKHLFIQ